MTAQKIVIIGCGNVAWHLAKQFKSLKGFSVSVYNHRPHRHLSEFKSRLKCKTTVGLDKVETDADLYFLCVSDGAISVVSKQVQPAKQNAIVLHTSGSIALNTIKGKQKHKGVFYPLQTFSRHDLINWKEVPLILEGSDRFTETSLRRIGLSFSRHLLFADHQTRLRFHLAAVLVNNFTNALYAAAYELTESSKNKDHFKLLMPLIRQTVSKLGHLDPVSAQTGPARRGDKEVMKLHSGLLPKGSQMKKIYKNLSELIIKQQSHA